MKKIIAIIVAVAVVFGVAMFMPKTEEYDYLRLHPELRRRRLQPVQPDDGRYHAGGHAHDHPVPVHEQNVRCRYYPGRG